MLLSLVVAAAENDAIGLGNQLPWRLPDDLKRFKSITLGKPVLMGRKTFESIGKPLPDRTNIVVSRRRGLQLQGCTVVPSIEDGLSVAAPAPELMVIGGAELFRELLPRADFIYLTRVHAYVAGDVFFPPLAADDWIELESEYHRADDRHAFPFTFLKLRRAHFA